MANLQIGMSPGHQIKQVGESILGIDVVGQALRRTLCCCLVREVFDRDGGVRGVSGRFSTSSAGLNSNALELAK